jgi:hypothetical protein
MSGGSYDYLYSRVRDAADQIDTTAREGHPGDPDPVSSRVYSRERAGWLPHDEALAVLARVDADRQWFAGLLRVVADALHAVEWVDSCDYGPGDEVESIDAVRKYLGGGE